MQLCKRYQFFVWFLLPLMLLANSPAYSSQFKVCYEDQEFSPYMLGSGSIVPDHKRGLLLNLIDVAAKDVGLNVTYIRRPWKRCIAKFQRNQVDAIFAAIFTEDRREWGQFPMTAQNNIDRSLRLYRVKYAVFYSEKYGTTWNGSVFRKPHKPIGAPLGYVAAKVLSDKNVKHTTNYLPEEGLPKLRQGALGGYIVEQKIGTQLVEKLGLKDVVASDTPFMSAEWFLPVSAKFYEKHQNLAERLWQGISKHRMRIVGSDE